MDKKASSLRMLLVFLVGVSLGFMVTQADHYWNKKKQYLSMDELTKKVTQYVDNEMFKGRVKVKITEMQPFGEVAKFKIQIPGQNGEYTSYVTREGTLLFPQGYEIKFSSKPSPSPVVKTQPTQQPTSATPSSKPTLQPKTK